MTMRVVAVSNKAEVRKRLSRGSLLLQTAQLQPNTGTPLDGQGQTHDTGEPPPPPPPGGGGGRA